MIDKFQLKKLVSDDLKSAFDKLEKVLASEDVRINEYLILRGRHNQVEGDRRKGILSNEEYYKEQNLLRLSYLGLIDELGDDTYTNIEEHENFPSENSNNERPRLEIELVPRGKWKNNRGLSRNNEMDENGAVWIHNAIYINEIGWKYKIVVRNNSSYPAFYPELEFENGKFNNQLDNLNKNKAIQPFEEIELNAKYSMRLEAKGRDAIEYMDSRYLPDELKDLSILLAYENEKGDKLMSRFKIVDGDGYNEMI